ncbi:PDZ domain-containing protein [Caenorhabditis elegans]|uniref:PDZ domain-containing protein n=1 Tax=Caenorhabditis elegans TaxID=6239 RepID=A0A679L8N1_CAEEL|nr:PDZ domain-containing protein [Caenorhabditis elegans]CAA9991425.1 PDZ domain-containing protein [Caenorhabditis elegans]
MTYETISVRMNRSDRNIRWGFSVRQQADGLIIDRVEAESLSDKAGVKHNDKVDQINGRSTRGLDAASANRLIDDSFNEVRLSLQRFVTSHTTLPWTLNEKDNKMVVEEMKPGFGTGFGSGFGSSNFVNSSFNQNQNNFGSHFGTGSGVNQRNITNTNTSSSNHQRWEDAVGF